jgi:hypothetical protein
MYFIEALSSLSLTPSTMQHALGAGDHVAVIAGLAVGGAAGEPAGRLEHDVHALGAPRQLGRVLLGQNRDLFAVDDQGAALGLDLAGELALRRVVPEHVSQHVGVEQIIDRDDVELVELIGHRAEHEATDAAKTVDSYLCCH